MLPQQGGTATSIRFVGGDSRLQLPLVFVFSLYGVTTSTGATGRTYLDFFMGHYHFSWYSCQFILVLSEGHAGYTLPFSFHSGAPRYSEVTTGALPASYLEVSIRLSTLDS